MGNFTEGFAVGFNAVQSARQRNKNNELAEQESKRRDMAQSLDALQIVQSLREREEGYSSQIDSLLTQRAALTADLTQRSAMLTAAEGTQQEGAILRARAEYAKADAVLTQLDSKLGALSTRQEMAHRQTTEISDFLAKNALLSSAVQFNDQVRQIQQPQGEESFQRPAYASPRGPQGSAPAQASEMAPPSMETMQGEQGQPEQPASPHQFWQQQAQARQLPTGVERDGQLVVEVSDPDMAKQLKEKYDALGKELDASHPFLVDDRTGEEAETTKYLTEQTDTYKAISEKIRSVKQDSIMLGKLNFENMDSAVTAATFDHLSKSAKDGELMKTLAEAAKGASPKARAEIVKAMQRHIEEDLIPEYEAELEKYAPEAEELHRRGRKKAGMKAGDSEAIAPEEGEAEVAFAERYAKANGWDWDKPLTKSQQVQIKRAYAKGRKK